MVGIGREREGMVGIGEEREKIEYRGKEPEMRRKYRAGGNGEKRRKKREGLIPAFSAKILYTNDFMVYNRKKGTRL